MPTLELELRRGGIVCGIDEAGRGPLAGPVVAAAVILAAALPEALAAAIDDSKRLSAKRREAVAAALPAYAAIGIGEASVEEIGRLNILRASLLAMQRAFADLARPVDRALVDGNVVPALPCPAECVVGGDGLSLSIAAASIVAKTRRDAIMAALAICHPGYGWERNAGYPTAEHLAALKRLGPTAHHRAHFGPVAAVFSAAATPR